MQPGPVEDPDTKVDINMDDVAAGATSKRIVTLQDDAAKALEGGIVQYTPEEEKRLIRKIDWILIPLLAVATGIMLVDKNGLSAAATLTIQKDLSLVGSQYSWAVSCYFFGQMLGTYPANLLSQRYHTGTVVSISFLCWGIVLVGTAGVKNFGQLVALLRLVSTHRSSSLYDSSLWVLSNTVMPIPFLLVFFGIGHAKDEPLEPWRWIFVLLGCLTIVYAAVAWFVFPDKPSNTKWLKPDERAIAVERIARSQLGIKNSKFKRYQAIEALKIPRLGCSIGVMYICQQSGVVLHTSFTGIIIKGIGYSGLKSLLLQIPVWALGSVTVVGSGYAVTKIKALRHAKTLILAGFACVSCICCAIIYTHPKDGTTGRNAMLLTLITLFNVNALGYPFILSLVGQNFAGTTKKQPVLTMIFTLYCASNIAVPQAFLADEAPRYQTGFLVVMSFAAVYVASSVTLFMVCKKENARRNRSGTETQGDEDAVWAGLQDMTDKENPRFRYTS